MNYVICERIYYRIMNTILLYEKQYVINVFCEIIIFLRIT